MRDGYAAALVALRAAVLEPAARDEHADSQDTVGASIADRRTYDLSIESWGANGPGFEARTPTIIVTHSAPLDVPAGVYTFVGSPREAVAVATAIAGDKDVDVFSASIGGQLLLAGLVDEVRIHLVPVLLGSGTRLLDAAGGPVRLQLTSVVEASKATHLRYRVTEVADQIQIEKGAGRGRPSVDRAR